MDGVLLTPLEAGPANADLAALGARLLAEVDQLRAEVATLRREKGGLRLVAAGSGAARVLPAEPRLMSR